MLCSKKISKVSSSLKLLYKVTTELTFENLY